VNVISQFPVAREYSPDLRFQAMFDGAAMAIGICQLDGRMVEANPALSRMLGYSRQELTGTHAGEFFSGLSCDVGRQLQSENRHSESCAPDQRLGELMRGERDSCEIERLYRRKDASEFWGRLTVSLGRDERCQPVYLIAMLEDATERRRAGELLLEAEKMEVLGRLVGGIVHDFNNLLTGILLYCDLLSARLESAESPDAGLDSITQDGPAKVRLENDESVRSELCEHLAEVRMAGEQGAALTRQLLAIARRPAAEPRPLPINKVVAASENLLRRLIGEQIELVVFLDPALDATLDPALDPALDSGAGLAVADPSRLHQVLLNLVLNARDALPPGGRDGKIILSTRAAQLPTEFRCEAGPIRTRRAVSLTVKDNGCGMDAETRKHLFEPFFTTKNPGKGTGLGLATVERIVSAAGGRIEVESEPGRGTSIEVFLPAIEPAANS
jgi:PAS domain S-box-containing protein